MLQLLLDEHIAPAVAEDLARIRPVLRVMPMREWHGGAFLGRPDFEILLAAFEQRLTLVTYDQKTIRPLLRLLANEGRSHAGVILVDDKTVAQGNVGGLVRALDEAAGDSLRLDWTDRTVFLERDRNRRHSRLQK